MLNQEKHISRILKSLFYFYDRCKLNNYDTDMVFMILYSNLTI